MRGLKEQNFRDRLSDSAAAKRATLERFRARPGADDPAVIAQREARQALVAAREQRIAERAAAKEVARQRAADEAEARRAQAQREAEEAARREADAALALLAEQKAARDARYAARKARKHGK